jgi:hypothetical protein
VVLDFMINSFRKSGVKSVAQYFGL